MTSTQINIEIAQLMGWKDVFEQRNYDGSILVGEVRGLKEGGSHYQVVPDYANSLDACHDFEKDAPDKYWRLLFLITNDDSCYLTATWEQCSIHKSKAIRLAKATPPQRCEAFLRLHGKWVD